MKNKVLIKNLIFIVFLVALDAYLIHYHLTYETNHGSGGTHCSNVFDCTKCDPQTGMCACKYCKDKKCTETGTVMCNQSDAKEK